MRLLRSLSAFGALCLLVSNATAGSIFVPIVGKTANITLDRVVVRDVLIINGQVSDGSSSISHIVRFKAPSNMIRGTVTWNVFNKARLVGVNVDILQSGNVVATDTFQGVLGGRAAVSTLDFSDLVPGATYQVQLTGTQVSTVNYSIVLEFGPLP